MPLPRLIAVALAASSLAVLPLGLSAMAAPFDKEACAALEVQQKKLLTPDMRAALERGPDWVKDHLDHEKIEKVREYLMVEEQVAFRCRTGGIARLRLPPVPLPDRNPRRPVSATADAKPSQTVADSDKTTPSGTKATR
jgi:hypothetical protein